MGVMMNHFNRRSLLAGMLGLPSLAEAVQTVSTPYRRPKLRITEVRTAEVRVHGYWVKEGEIIVKGYITPPERAGLGVEMNDEGARKAQVPGTPWFAPALP
jgi:L-alanine-DL-glutamate epimerase-like enolase superfamily enzyme